MKFGYKVVINTNETSNERSEEPYGPWSVTCENRLGSVFKGGEYPDVVSTDDIPVGNDAFLIWAEWSSGDSFGQGERNNAEPFGLFAKYEDAQKFHDELAAKKGYDVPWNGYFESLDEIHLDKVFIRAESKSPN